MSEAPVEPVRVTVTQAGDGFRATATAGALPPVWLDEPESVGGSGSAPSPLEYLLTAVGGCLTASLTFCLRKKRIAVPFRTEVEGFVERDEEGMLRVQRIRAEILVAAPDSERRKVEGCYAIFKKYCVVSSSVARGIPVETSLVYSDAQTP